MYRVLASLLLLLVECLKGKIYKLVAQRVRNFHGCSQEFFYFFMGSTSLRNLSKYETVCNILRHGGPFPAKGL